MLEMVQPNQYLGLNWHLPLYRKRKVGLWMKIETPVEDQLTDDQKAISKRQVGGKTFSNFNAVKSFNC